MLGLSTICWVMPVSPVPEVRKLLGVVRVCSGKSILLAGLPIGKGLMLMSGIEGAANVPAVHQRRGIIELHARETLSAIPFEQRSLPATREFRDLLMISSRSGKGDE